MRAEDHEDYHGPQKCLRCDELTDMASCLTNDARPKPGDVTLCLYCGHVMAFDDALKFRELNESEGAAVSRDPFIVRAKAARFEVMKRSRQ